LKRTNCGTKIHKNIDEKCTFMRWFALILSSSKMVMARRFAGVPGIEWVGWEEKNL